MKILTFWSPYNSSTYLRKWENLPYYHQVLVEVQIFQLDFTDSLEMNI